MRVGLVCHASSWLCQVKPRRADWAVDDRLVSAQCGACIIVLLLKEYLLTGRLLTDQLVYNEYQ
jgi:hypothetical protein